MLVEDELEPLGLVDDEAAPPVEDEPLVPPVDEDPEPPLIAPPADEPEPEPPALLDEPPVPDVDDVSAGVLGVVDDDEDELPGTGTTVVDEEDEPLGVVEVEPPGTTVVVSFFSHADSAKAPISTNTYPLYFMFTLLSSESHAKIALPV